MDRKLKIMHILSTGGYSGAENVAISLIDHSREYTECTYVSPGGQIREILAKRNIEYIPVKKISVSEIRRAIKESRPDIIHAHDFTAGIAAAAAAGDLPVINHLHNNPPWIREKGCRSHAYLFATLRFKRIVTVSDAVLNEYVFNRYIRNKTIVIGNPIDNARIRMRAEEAEKAEKFEASDVLFLGRMVPQKNPFRFLDIIEKIKKKRPEITVFMIGQGAQFEDIRKEIYDRNLAGTITMMGFIDNPYGYLKHTKVLCMPSSWEGFGLAAVEALALGVPVVSSGKGGLKDIVTDSCGRNCGKVNEYVSEIAALIKDEPYRKMKSDNALIRARELDNISAYFRQIRHIYMEAAGKKVRNRS